MRFGKEGGDVEVVLIPVQRSGLARLDGFSPVAPWQASLASGPRFPGLTTASVASSIRASANNATRRAWSHIGTLCRKSVRRYSGSSRLMRCDRTAEDTGPSAVSLRSDLTPKQEFDAIVGPERLWWRYCQDIICGLPGKSPDLQLTELSAAERRLRDLGDDQASSADTAQTFIGAVHMIAEITRIIAGLPRTRPMMRRRTHRRGAHVSGLTPGRSRPSRMVNGRYCGTAPFVAGASVPGTGKRPCRNARRRAY